MNLHQFRFVQEAVRRDLNLTETAKALFTSQPGISQGDPRARGRARRRHLRAPRQAAAPRHRARAAGAEGDRDHHARGRQPEAHRRGVLEAGRRHAVDRHHAHPGALLPARAGGRSCASAFRRSTSACTRARPSRWRRCCSRRSPRSAWPPSRSADFDELVTLPCYEWQHVVVMPAGAPAGAGRAALARAPGGRAAGLLPPVVHRPHAHRPGLRGARA